MKTNFDLKPKKGPRKDRRLNIFLFTAKVVEWLRISCLQDVPSIPTSLLIDLCNRLDKIIKTRGIKEALSYVKATRGNFYNYLSGNILRLPGSPCYGVSQFPSILGPLKSYVDNDNHDVIRLILTILSSTRAIKLKGEVCTDSITQPCKRDVPDLTQYMPDF